MTLKKSWSALGLIVAFVLAGCSNDWVDYSPMDMYMADIGYDDSQASRFLNVAAASLQPDKTDKTVTLSRLEAMVDTIMAEHPETQVIVFPELALEWYWDDIDRKEYQTAMAEAIPGTSTDAVKAIALANNVSIAFGMTELDGTDLYNSQVLIEADGTLVKYRKRNLNLTDIDNGMKAGVAPGDAGLVTADIGGVTVCLFICSDMQSAAITREIADSGVEVILHSLTSTTDLNPTVSYLGMQMNTWIVFSNRFGVEGEFDYSGFVQVINPAGTVSERASGQGGYAFRKLGLN